MTNSRAFLFCTSYLQAGLPNRTSARWLKWHTYYSARLSQFGADRLFLIDDASPSHLIPSLFHVVDADATLPRALPPGPVMFRFRKHLGRRSVQCFPGWWRSFTFASKVASRYHYSKLIHLESDAYVVSPDLARYIRRLHHGWKSAWCDRWEFPETAVQVICGDSIPRLEHFRRSPERYWYAAAFAELTLPFGRIPRRFLGDRYGEYRKEWPREADYVCQALTRWDFESCLVPEHRGRNPPRSTVRAR